MAKKTNKTSHVMDLLTNGASGEASEPTQEAVVSADPSAGQDKKNDNPSHTGSSPKVTVVDEGSRNDRLSQEILNKLSEELEDETKTKAASSAPETSNKTMSADEIAAAFAAAQASSAPEPAPAPASESSNRTMSADEIAAAFAAAQASSAPAPQPAPASESSSRTMSADEIAAAFAAAQASSAPAAPTPEPAPAQASESSNKTMSADEIAAAFAAAQASSAPAPAAPEPAPAAPAPQPAPAAEKPLPPSQKHHAIIPKSQIGQDFTDDQYRFVNVMEQLILRQDINNYMEQYNVCKCRRCMSDVCALALTGLPSKYVVASKESLPPILSFYGNKYKIYMMTELIKACNKVREFPRHDRPQQ